LSPFHSRPSGWLFRVPGLSPRRRRASARVGPSYSPPTQLEFELSKPRKRAERLAGRDLMWLTLAVVVLVMVAAVLIAWLAPGPALGDFAKCLGATALLIRALSHL
jgi:hypothetical protein